MPLNITTKKFELTDAIREYVEKKVSTFQKRLDTITVIDVELERNNHHKKGDVFHARMSVEVPHKLLYTVEEAEDLYAAIDICRDEIQRQIEKYTAEFEARKRQEQKTRRAMKSMSSIVGEE